MRAASLGSRFWPAMDWGAEFILLVVGDVRVLRDSVVMLGSVRGTCSGGVGRRILGITGVRTWLCLGIASCNVAGFGIFRSCDFWERREMLSYILTLSCTLSLPMSGTGFGLIGLKDAMIFSRADFGIRKVDA